MNRLGFRVLAAAGLLALLTSCGSTGGSPTPAPSGGAAGVQPTAYPLGQGLVWTGPVGSAITPFPATLGSTASCQKDVASITVAGVDVQLSLPTAGCVEDKSPPINGQHGWYVAPPSYATGVSSPTPVPVGTVVTFSQAYTEYTNSRTDFSDAVALVTLTTPTSSGRSILMLVTTSQPDQAAEAAGLLTLQTVVKGLSRGA